MAALGQRIPTTVEPLHTWINAGAISLPDGEKCSQKWWAEKVATQRKLAVRERATGRNAARLEAIAEGRGGDL